MALSCPRKLLLKNVPPLLWRFLPQIIKLVGKFVRMDDSNRLIPHLDTRILVSIKQGIDIPDTLNLTIENEVYPCPLETLGGLNACFLLKKEGHQHKNYPNIKKRTVGNKADPTKGDQQNLKSTNSIPSVNGPDTTPPPANNPPSTSMNNLVNGVVGCDNSANVRPLQPVPTPLLPLPWTPSKPPPMMASN